MITSASFGPRTLGETVSTIFSGYRKLFGPLLIIGVSLGMLHSLVEILQLDALARIEDDLLPGPAFFLAGFGSLLGGTYFWTVALLRADSIFRDAALGGEFTRALRIMPRLVGYLVVYVALTMIGMFLLVAPGIFIAVLLVPGLMLIVLRDSGVFAAVKGSVALVWGSWWFSLGIVLIVFLITVVVLAVAEATGAGLKPAFAPQTWVLTAGIGIAAMVLVFPLNVAMTHTWVQALEARRMNATMEREVLNR